ncbi:M23 family metallopeptidase [Streptomyces roseicoloratus]|uniref:M23 family metallopeptidase n=1 Tax=Streptomyces roseicoloratus TaxID=2508722 RepID=A0ABY9RRM6_9ACTN|nr:M23 family metallopeptidase [Streptomyces roseicoloratus]WMX44829.1 M23 family metallopeptidase [Streptomyces roseicoloratus]
MTLHLTPLATPLTTLLLTLATAVWPIGPPRPDVLRDWQPPPGPYAAGHRGIDLAAPPGTPVRAPATGTITFAGPVAGHGVLTLTLPDTGTPPLRTTYTRSTPSSARAPPSARATSSPTWQPRTTIARRAASTGACSAATPT